MPHSRNQRRAPAQHGAWVLGECLLIVALSLALMEALASTRHAQAVTPTPIAKYYSIGRIEQTARTRGLFGTRPDTSGYASTPDCGNIGKVAEASFLNPHTKEWGPVLRLLIVDCSAPADSERHIAEGLVIETDYATAEAGGWAWTGTEGAGKTDVNLIDIH